MALRRERKIVIDKSLSLSNPFTKDGLEPGGLAQSERGLLMEVLDRLRRIENKLDRIERKIDIIR
jgi:hypothetical protein